MSTAKLMTNINPIYSNFLNNESKRNKKTKRVIIETALDLYMKELQRKEIYDSYKTMEQDQEYLNELKENSELGMDYFLTDLNLDVK